MGRRHRPVRKIIQRHEVPGKVGAGIGVNIERHRSRRGLRHPAVSTDQDNEQASVAGLQPADDLLPNPDLVDAGITEILVVTGGKNAGDFLRLLGNGKEFGLKHLDYTYQEGEGGIAAALSWPSISSRTIWSASFSATTSTRRAFASRLPSFIQRGRGAKIHLKQVENPQRFGVPIINGDRISRSKKNRKLPKSDYAVTGLYMYDQSVFDIIKTLKPSGRGELEITDVNNAYIERNEMTYAVVDGWWSDAGTFDSLLRANILVASQFEGESRRNFPGRHSNVCVDPEAAMKILVTGGAGFIGSSFVRYVLAHSQGRRVVNLRSADLCRKSSQPGGGRRGSAI